MAEPNKKLYERAVFFGSACLFLITVLLVDQKTNARYLTETLATLDNFQAKLELISDVAILCDNF